MYINNYNIFCCGCKIRAAPEIKSWGYGGAEVLGGASCFICALYAPLVWGWRWEFLAEEASFNLSGKDRKMDESTLGIWVLLLFYWEISLSFKEVHRHSFSIRQYQRRHHRQPRPPVSLFLRRRFIWKVISRVYPYRRRNTVLLSGELFVSIPICLRMRVTWYIYSGFTRAWRSRGPGTPPKRRMATSWF